MSRAAPLLPVLLVALSLTGCSCSDPTPVGGACTKDADCATGRCVGGACVAADDLDAGVPGPDGSVGSDAAVPDGSIASCLATGAACAVGTLPGCCSGLCATPDGGTPRCEETKLCAVEGAACSAPSDCCTLTCTAGKCGGSLCLPIDTACAAATECCSGICTAGKCAKIPTSTCGALGEVCQGAGDCCSKNCQGGRCVRASFCSTAGDVCYQATDCCNGTCKLGSDAGTAPGTCALGLTVPGATDCTIGGEVCEDSGGCCSHLCLDLGSGRRTCVLGSGCRERGEICQDTSECCGHDTSGVTCQKAAPGDLVGRCANPQACQPIGNCCGAFGDSCRQACCDGQKAVCKKDGQGLARCFGGCPNDVCPKDCPDGFDGLDPKCCVAEGQECQFRDQCCGLSPCLKEGEKYVCRAPRCVAAGQHCVPGAVGEGGCCNGLSCLADGEIDYVCRTGGTSPAADAGVGPATDAGDLGYDAGPPPDGGPTCTPNLATCAAAGECCSGLCLAGKCATCRTDGTACAAANECCSGVCTGGKCVPPATCVSSGGACSGTSECCAGTFCDLSAGAANATCRTGSTCSSGGQGCAASSECCVGLICVDPIGGLCDPGESCACVVEVN